MVKRKRKVDMEPLPGEMSVTQALKLAASIAALGAALGVNPPSALASRGHTRERAGEYTSSSMEAGTAARGESVPIPSSETSSRSRWKRTGPRDSPVGDLTRNSDLVSHCDVSMVSMLHSEAGEDHDVAIEA